MIGKHVVITAAGAASPLGLSAEQMWENMLNSQSGIDLITAFGPENFPCKIAGQVPPYKIRDYLPKSQRKAVKLMSRDIELAIIAADDAVRSANLKTNANQQGKHTFDPAQAAVNFGAGLISADLLELAPAIASSVTDGKFDLHKWGNTGMQQLTPIWLLKYLPNMPACHVGIIHDIQGPSNTITCGEVSGFLSIAEAADQIARNNAEIALAGGCEAKVNPIVMLRQCLINRALADGVEDPKSAHRPFDSQAKGCVFSEGAAVVVLESMTSAVGRGANIYAQLAGSGASTSMDPDCIGPDPDGAGLEYAIAQALDDAGIAPDQIDVIIPHGTAVPDDDLAELRALESVFSKKLNDINVFPTKTMLGNTGAAAGAMDVIVAANIISRQTIPPAINFTAPAAGISLNISKEKIEKNINCVLCCGYTFGGQTAAIVLKKHTGQSK